MTAGLPESPLQSSGLPSPMYENVFRLQRSPFRMVPDQDCLHLTGQHADVISGAVFGILEHKGFVVLTGEAGVGKTTAIRAVMGMLAESKAEISLISHPTLSAEDFLELALLNFGMSSVASSKAQRLKALESFVTLADTDGRVCVLIVDEAHKLPPDALEEIRLLGNLQTNTRKLLQILLVGQNELNTRLDLPELWQLKQRVAFRLNLNCLDREGVEQYIRFRWTNAGGAELPFEAAALDGIAKWSNGVPRLVNAICDNALMLALSETSRIIRVQHVQLVCQDLHLATPALPMRMEQEKATHVRGEVPVLVSQTAVGGRGQAASIVEQVKPVGAPLPESDSWSVARPSLLKKWRGFMESQKPSAALKNSSLSLKNHL